MTDPSSNRQSFTDSRSSRLSRRDWTCIPLDSDQPLPAIHSPYRTEFSLHESVAAGQVAQRDTGESIRLSVETGAGKIWLEGNSLFCACPQCSAPVSVRLWLLTADCWQCDTRIQLSREQEEAVERLLRSQRNRSAEVPARSDSNRQVTTAAPAATPPTAPTRSTPRRGDRPRRRTAGERTPTERVRQMRARRSTLATMREALRMTPAWLISFLLHLVLIIILLMLYFENVFNQEEEGITLSTAISVEDKEGAEITVGDPERELDFEAPLPRDADLSDLEVKKALVKADQDARELRVDDQPQTQLPDLQDVKRSLTRRTGESSRFIARDPRLRVEILEKEGGTSLTEAAVARGLRWLAKVQNEDGSWSLQNYKYHYRKDNQGDMAATALALLPFLGAGQTNEYGRYKDTVARGLKWMIEHQDPHSGDLRNGLPNHMAMYAQGQAAIVLTEAYAMTGDERFREPAQKAIDFIVGAQRSSNDRLQRGGWRYQPNQVGDTSVFGWQMMALQSALSPQLGLEVPRKTMLMAQDFLDVVGNPRDGETPANTFYGYLRGNEKTPAMTAEALLCRVYLGWKRDDIRLKIATEYLLKRKPPSDRYDWPIILDDEFWKDKNKVERLKRSTPRYYNLYYIYYATQLFHHYGGPEWKAWNDDMQRTLVPLQETEGTYAGSWDPDQFRWGSGGQRIYTTAIAVCTLEVYYRHLPLFKQLDIDVAEEVEP